MVWRMKLPAPWTLPQQPTSTRLLRAAGVSPEMIRTQLNAGRLVRLRHGVYIAAAQWPDSPAARHVLLSRAEVIANLDAVISDHSAAVVWGLPSPDFGRWHDNPVSVTFPAGGRHGALCRANQHRVRELPANQVVRDEAGFPITSLPRTAVDLARMRPLPQALAILDAAARLMITKRVDKPARADYVDPVLVSGARAELEVVAVTRAPLLRDVIPLVQPCRESVPESLAAGYFHLAGLPTPQFQAQIRTRRGTYYPDCYWEERRLIGECDGKVKYATAEGYIKEKVREQAFRDDDYQVVRWLAIESMTRPLVLLKRVARMLGIDPGPPIHRYLGYRAP